MWSDPSFCLDKIAEAATDVKALLEGLAQEEFEQLPERNRMAYRAIKTAVVETGGAINGLPPELRDRHGGIDWRGLVRLRDVVVHYYPKLDLTVALAGAEGEFPTLLAASGKSSNRKAGASGAERRRRAPRVQNATRIASAAKAPMPSHSASGRVRAGRASSAG